MSKNNIRKLFPRRLADSHKGDYGKIFILAGSDGMLGAAILCSRGAIRSGAGLVYLGVPSKSTGVVNIATPEIIVSGGESANDFANSIQKASSIVIGPGLGERRNIGRELLLTLSENKFPHPVVIDADGLLAFEKDISQFTKMGLNLILTPHPGEMGQLLGRKTDEIQNNREKVAVETAKQLNCIVVLKGSKTIVADKNGNKYINKTGNPGMATAGTGDVLAGIIGGLAGQKFSSWDAAVAGVYIHGLAGDLSAKDKGEYGMIASDIIYNIPYAIKQTG